MPSLILHTLFGEDLITALNLKDKINKENHGIFMLGCQGPDIFYHNQRSKPIALQYGSLLHRRNYGSFCAALLRNTFTSRLLADNDSLKAYVTGFISHSVLDRVCHPYIIYKTIREHHSFFERILDVLMLKRLRGLDPLSYDNEKILSAVCENPPHGLKELLAGSLAKAFPEKVNKDRSLSRRIDNAFTDCARFYRLSSPKRIQAALLSAKPSDKPVFTRRSLFYAYPENLSEDIDFLNLKNAEWYYPYNTDGQKQKADTRSFPEIYTDAVQTAAAVFSSWINQYFGSNAFIPEEIAELIGNGSLSIHDEEGKACAANITDPFPLDDVLQQQVKIRKIV